MVNMLFYKRTNHCTILLTEQWVHPVSFPVKLPIEADSTDSCSLSNQNYSWNHLEDDTASDWTHPQWAADRAYSDYWEDACRLSWARFSTLEPSCHLFWKHNRWLLLHGRTVRKQKRYEGGRIHWYLHRIPFELMWETSGIQTCFFSVQ